MASLTGETAFDSISHQGAQTGIYVKTLGEEEDKLQELRSQVKKWEEEKEEVVQQAQARIKALSFEAEL